MRITETILEDGEDILVGMLFPCVLSDVLKGFPQIGRDRNPRPQIAAVARHIIIRRIKEGREEREKT